MAGHKNMKDYLILKLQGPMQAWGEHSFEGLRPSNYVPTRSAVIGLLGACLGIRREEKNRYKELVDSIGMAVRVDTRRSSDNEDKGLMQQKMTDYHTIKNARKDYHGLGYHETIQTWREYLMDAEFTVAIWDRGDDRDFIGKLDQAVKKPHFTPYLGRRSCPIARPLFEGRLEADNEFSALGKVPPAGGEIYSETPGKVRSLKVRDVPLVHQPRQFASRIIYVYGGDYVPE
jgi:CRISPR system Cascade subunit CasD